MFTRTEAMRMHIYICFFNRIYTFLVYGVGGGCGGGGGVVVEERVYTS
jgi:hypothetical protein